MSAREQRGPIAVKLSMPGRRNPMPILTRALGVSEPRPVVTPSEPTDAVSPLGAAIDWALYVNGVRQPEQVANYDELMSSILQAAVSRLSVSENEDMRKISAWVAIAAVPTMIAGVYGMNFRYMPELESPWGYPVVAAVMVGACWLLYRNFRRQRWL